MIGGGDGLALREVLQWSPESVVLVDLDPGMISLFSGKSERSPKWLSKRLTELNENSLNDKRVEIIYGDAFKVVEGMQKNPNYYDLIIVDLPDPSHPDLNKLYSDYFYSNLGRILSQDGAMVVQSTSLYHSKDAFLSIRKTMESVSLSVDQYHANVPSFGEWGWTLATKKGMSPLKRIEERLSEKLSHHYLNKELIIGSFSFSESFFDNYESIKVNNLNAPILYSYHSNGWKKGKGIYFVK